jgi:hypothetical protein
VLTAVFTIALLAACGQEPSDTTDRAGTANSDNRVDFDYAPSCKVADDSQFLDDREDHYPEFFLGEGVGFHRGHPSEKQTPFDRPDPIDIRFLGEVDARAFVVGHDTYDDVLEDGLPYEMSAFEWGRDFRVSLHEVVQSDSGFGLPAEGSEDPAAHDDGYAYFFVAVESVRTTLGELPFYNSPDWTMGLQRTISEYGLGYVDSITYGGWQVFSVPLEELSADERSTLVSMIENHTDASHKLDVEGFADASSAGNLPVISYGMPSSRGTRPTDGEFLAGNDLFSVMAAVPERLEEIRQGAREAAETDETNLFTGTVLDSTRTPYTTEQLRSTDMTEAEIQKYECYREFMIEAYRAETIASNSPQRARCFDERANDQSYIDSVEPLQDLARSIRERRDECYDEVIRSDENDLCGVCQMPEGASLVDVRALADPIPGYTDYRAFPERSTTAQ